MDENTILFFDLDDTIYPKSSGLWDAIGKRIDLYIYEKLAFPQNDVPAIRKNLFSRYGTTLRGLQIEYGIDPYDYLAFVHDIPLDQYLNPNPKLNQMLEQLPNSKYIFTNSDSNHATRVLDSLEINPQHFTKIIDILSVSPFCKPHKEAFYTALTLIEPTTSDYLLIDDNIHNIETAENLGWDAIYVNEDGINPNSFKMIRSISELTTYFENEKPKDKFSES
ncbi:MAG: pyrimidine 5'-nucleotidase [Anaerolineaceae bacterium]|jgi:pyrimidine 5'-nucleotidase